MAWHRRVGDLPVRRNAGNFGQHDRRGGAHWSAGADDTGQRTVADLGGDAQAGQEKPRLFRIWKAESGRKRHGSEFRVRGGGRGGKAQPDGYGGLFAQSPAIRRAGSANAPGRAALRAAGHRQDAAGPGAGGGSGGAVFRPVGFGLCADVCGGRRGARAGIVRGGPEGGTVRDFY